MDEADQYTASGLGDRHHKGLEPLRRLSETTGPRHLGASRRSGYLNRDRIFSEYYEKMVEATLTKHRAANDHGCRFCNQWKRPAFSNAFNAQQANSGG